MEVRSLIVVYYFDWAGSRNGLVGWVEAVRAECERQGVGFMGLFGPSQVKFNWAFMCNCEGQEHYHRMLRELRMPAEVTHAVIHYFWPEKTFLRDLPKYPPAHFIEPP